MKPRVVVNYESSSSEDEFHRIGRQQSKRRKLHSKREKDIEYSSDKESDDEDRDAESSVGEGSSVEEGSRDEKQECERRLCRATETDEPDGNQESTGMANVLNTILGEKVDDEVILVKGATDKQINAKKIKANQEGSDNKPKNAQFACLEERKKWNEMNHESPNILNLPKEKFLKKIATRGIVIMFNAVKKQQQETVKKARSEKTTSKKEFASKTTIKQFLDKIESSDIKTEQENKADFLKEDFMDKIEDDSGEDENMSTMY